MKKLYVIFVVLGLDFHVHAQCSGTPAPLGTICEEGKGINTDPENAINCEYPNLKK